MENLEDRVVPAIQWAAAVSGSFTDDTKWVGGVAPGAADDAVIPFTGITVTVGTRTVQSLTNSATLSVSGGTFAVTAGGSNNGTITVASGSKFDVDGGTFGWSAGTVSGAGIFEVSPATNLSISGATAKAIVSTALNNLGTVNLGGTGDLLVNNDAAINNSGTFAFTGDMDVSYAAGATRTVFTNTGTVTKSSGAGLGSAFSTVFDNTAGTIAVNSGQLNLFSGTSSGGTYNIAAGAVLNLTGAGTQNYTGAFTGSGAGTVLFDGGTINVTLTNASFNFPTGLLQWTGGLLTGLAGSTLTNSGTITLAGAVAKTLGNVALLNTGTIALTGTADLNGGNLIVTNSGTINFQSDTDILHGFGTLPVINNTGTVKKSAGSLSVIDVPFNNSAGGLVEVQSGTLDISRGGVGASTFDASASASLKFTDAYTLNAGAEFTGAGLTILTSGAGITLNAPITAENFRWEASGFGGSSGSLEVTDTLEMASGGAKFLSDTLLINSGNATWTGTGDFQFGNGATFTNSGTFVIQNDEPASHAFGAVGNTFSNTGILIKNSAFATGTTTIETSVLFTNTGTLQVNSGTFLVKNGLNSGPIDIASGATLRVEVTAVDLNAGTTISGNGTVAVASGTVNVNTPLTIANLALSGGAMVGVVPLTVTDSVQWTGGTVAVPTSVNSGATLNLSGGVNKNLSNATLTNNGVATLSGTGFFDLGNGAAFQNNGSFTFLSDATVRHGFGFPGNSFSNSGTLTKTSTLATGTTRFQTVAFNNAGTVNVNSGILQSDLGTHSGSFNINPLARMRFAVDLNTLNAGAQFNGAGMVDVISSGDLFVTAPIAIPHLLLNDGTLSGTSALTVTSDFDWQVGGIGTPSQPFTLIVAPGATATASGVGTKFIDTGTLRNEGNLSFTSSANIQFGNAATLRNLGTFNIATDADFQYTFGAVNNRIINSGTMIKTAEIGTTTISTNIEVNNTGTIEVASGTIDIDGAVTQLIGGTLTAGAWMVDAGATLILPANVTTNNAAVTLDGAGSTLPQIAGLATNNGTFRLAGGRDLSLNGSLTNSGTLILGPASTLTIPGAYTQTTAGTFVSEIGDQPASGQFGVLAVTGAATLDGTVRVDLVNGFGPTAGGNFEIMTFASTTGNFTFVSPSSPKQGDLFAPVVNPTSLVAQSVVNASDLAVNAIFVPASGNPGANIQIGFEVKNLSTTATVVSDWIDSVYLSLDNLLDPSDILVERVNHSGILNADEIYVAQTNIALPGINPNNYKVIVVTDSRSFVPDTNRTNNKVASAATLAVTVPTVTIGTVKSGTIANAQDIYYRVDLPAGKTVKIGATFAVPSELEMYVSYQQVPSREDFDQMTFPVGQLSGQIILPGTQAGPFYILLHGREGATGGKTFNLLVEVLTFAITDLDNAKGSNLGSTTATINGAGFTPTTTVRLQGGVVDLAATQVFFVDSTKLYATFNLIGVPAGQYDVTVFNGATPASIADAFTVTTGAAGRLVTRVSAPAITRALFPTTVTVDYENTGETDIVAPVMTLTADWADMRLPEQEDFVGRSVQFVGINPNGPAGILPAGFKGSITFPAISRSSGAHVGIRYDLKIINNLNSPIDWNTAKANMRPASIPADAWDAVFANFVLQVGTTAGSYQQALSNNATYLSQLGETTYDVSRLISLEYLKANASLSGTTLASVVDATIPSPGLSLNFSRAFDSTISGRYAVGRLGRGWTDNWDISATTDADGNATIHKSGGLLTYRRNADGSYRNNPGNFTTLTGAGGAYQLRYTDGTLTNFRPDGKLDFIEDNNDNRVTAGFDGQGRLTTLTHSSGAALTLAYDGQGRVASVTDSAQRVSSYTYIGDHLATHTDRFGTTAFAYLAGQGTAREHALSQVTSPNGAQVFFDYDAQGRLAGQSQTSIAGVPQQALAFAYGVDGDYSLTDAAGGRSQLFLDDKGNVRRAIDPAGNTSQFDYCDCGHLRTHVFPDGTTFTYDYDDRGNKTKTTDPLGQTTVFAYSPTNRLTAHTDPRGKTTQYAYDAKDNLSRITYADGQFEAYGYDAAGNLSQSTNARGQTLQYAYNTLGLVTVKSYADTSVTTFTYDDNNDGFRLLTATDAAGDYDFTYNALDQIATYADPFGHTLAFGYNTAGQRLSSVDQLGFTVKYLYDAAGRLDQLTDSADANIVDYTYDVAGRVTREDKGNGTFSAYAFDLVGNLSSVTHNKDAGTVNSKYDYAYDSLNRVTAMTTGGVVTTYGYDAAGQLTAIARPGRSIQYAYDTAGNRAAVTDNGVTTVYTADSRNRYTAAGTVAFTYDADGNLASKMEAGTTTLFTFDQENRLTGLATPALGDSLTYQTDPFGQRVAVTHNSVVTRSVIDPIGMGNFVGEYDGAGTLTARYTHGMGLASRIDAGGVAAYYDADHVNSTVGLTDAGGDYVNRYSYLPFGETTVLAAGLSNAFTYHGGLGAAQGAGGLVHMRYRDYDAGTGQFTAADPIGLLGGDGNVRRFVGNNPLKFVDPTGLGYFAKGPLFGIPYVPGLDTGVNDGLNLGLYHEQYFRDDGTNFGYGADGKWFQIDPVKDKALLDKYKRQPGDYDDKIIDQIKKDMGEHPGICYGYVVHNCQGVAQELRDEYKKRMPPPPPGDSGGGDNSDNRTDNDPNELVGPSGFGAQGFIVGAGTLPYIIRFENKSDATLPTQIVRVTQTLDDDLDMDSLQLNAFNFGNYTVQIPAGRDNYTARVDAIAQFGLYVDITVGLDRKTRLLSILYESIDPLTLDVTADPLAGFLPPNNADHEGEGYVSYTVKSKTGLPTGTQINGNFARIVFGNNAPIDTNTTLNTIDVGTPTANVSALPDVEPTLTFPVAWTGVDDVGGSGVGTFDVYSSDNGGPWTLWQSQTAALTADFTGLEFHTYDFYAVGYDNVGNAEANVAAIESSTVATAGAFARADVYGVDAGKKLTVSAKTGLLANDPKKAGKTYAVQPALTLPTHGTLALKPDGSFTYTPDGTFAGLDSFTYQSKDSDGLLGNIATVTLATQIVNFKTSKTSVSEAKSTVSIVVNLRKPATAVTTVDYKLQGGTATAGADFNAASGTVTFQPGEKSKTIAVALINDTTDEFDETFKAILANPTGAVVGMNSTNTVTIKDNDAAPKVGFSLAGSTFSESAGTITILISLSAASAKPVSVQFYVPTGVAGGTAQSGVDYAAVSLTTLTFAPGETVKSITISLTPDALKELDETIKIKFKKATNATLGMSLHNLTVTDDD